MSGRRTGASVASAMIIVAAFGVASPGQAIVVMTTPEADNYRECVERVADRDPAVRTGLVKAVASQQIRGYSTYRSAGWKQVFEQRVMPKCGRAPKISCVGEPPCAIPDERHSAYIAIDEVQARGNRVYRAAGEWRWRPKVGGGR